MKQLTTGPIEYGQFLDEIRFIAEILEESGVETLDVCCAFGIDPDDPLFGQFVSVQVNELLEYLRGLETAGLFRLGQANISLITKLDGFEFLLGNDLDLFCKGDESPRFDRVRRRWLPRYPQASER